MVGAPSRAGSSARGTGLASFRRDFTRVQAASGGACAGGGVRPMVGSLAPGSPEPDAERILAAPDDLAVARPLAYDPQGKFGGAVNDVGRPEFGSAIGHIEDNAIHDAAALVVNDLAAEQPSLAARVPPIVSWCGVASIKTLHHRLRSSHRGMGRRVRGLAPPRRPCAAPLTC